MAQYGCSRCGSTASVMEMRRVVATIGPDKELQASGIVPVQRCLNDQCGSLSTLTNLEIGEAVNLVPSTPNVPDEPDLTDEDLGASQGQFERACASPPIPEYGKPED